MQEVCINMNEKGIRVSVRLLKFHKFSKDQQYGQVQI